MREFIVLNPDIQGKLRADIFSAVEKVNENLSVYLIIDSLIFYKTFLSVIVGTTSKDKHVTSIEINCLCRLIDDVFVKFGVLPHSSCRLIGIDFCKSNFTLAVNL